MTDLETRIARLEAESAIRRLKARYLNACDAKDPEAIRACFTPDADLDYQPIGRFGVDGLIEVFTSIAVHSPIVDSHHGHNAEIEVLSDDRATGRWNLGFATYDPRERSFRLLSSFYQDEYVKTPDGWRISVSRNVPRTVIDGRLTDDGVAATSVLP